MSQPLSRSILPYSQWRERKGNHQARAERLLKQFRHPGQYHPVYDFLFEYYPVRPSHLKRWHPGLGTALCDAAATPPHLEWRDYHVVETEGSTAVELDLPAFWERRGKAISYIGGLLERTAVNPVSFDCFGLHEWAMVYHTDSPRHSLPLRLGAAATNEVVDSHKLRCSHYDAYRFFTPPARPLNLTVLEREGQPDNDQAGCVHVTMDLFKWAWKLGPLVPGELFLDALELAIDARTLDMEASPYDCRQLGLSVVAIETASGKAEYVRRQRELANRAAPLRRRMIEIIAAASGIATQRSSQQAG